MTKLDTDNTISTRRASNPQAAAMDARRRSADAKAKYPEFFLSPEHLARVAAVERIVGNFFTVRKDMYTTARAGTSDRFTVVKIANPDFPRLPRKQVDAQFREPLRELNIEIIWTKNTNNYLFRIR